MTPLPLDLLGCASEPIRVPGAIQPHGWLVAFETVSARVAAYSENCEQLTGLAPGSDQTAALQTWVDTLRPRLASALSEEAPLAIGTTLIAGRTLDVTHHRAGSLAVLEFEPASTQTGTQAQIYSLARRFVPLIQKAASVVELASLAAAEMKRLTGFGRSMVYSFDSEGHGTVLAERADAGYDSYLGHCFPATDIPSQARELYLLNHIRLIPDANYQPVRLCFADASSSAQTLDLSFAHLRSVSPIHLEYMRNMGTLASMSVSIVVRGRLWGLISCHDHQPRTLDIETRFACEHLGRLLSLQIEAKEDNADIEMGERLQTRALEIVSRLGESRATLQSLVDEPELLLGLAHAGGAAVVFDDQCWTAGRTPTQPQILALADWIRERRVEVCDTDNLGASNAPVRPDLHDAAGLLAISLSKVHRHIVIWFRPELVRSIRWAGEGIKSVDEQGRLHPRRSFKSWEEIVRGRCAPWAVREISAVLELRQSLLGIVLYRAQERADAAGKLGRATLAKDLAEQANRSKTHFLAVLSHELRTPLAAISTAAELLLRHADIPARFSTLVPMIKRNVLIETRLIDDLLDLSAISAGKLHVSTEQVDMSALVEEVVDMLRQDVGAKNLNLDVEPSATPLRAVADPVRMHQVIWNILRNAIKFTPSDGQIRIRSDVRDGEFVFTCKDSGIGIEADALSRIFIAFEQGDMSTHHRFGGLGLGLAIANGIVESHGGKLEAASEGLGHGATLTLRFPAAPLPAR